MDARFALPAALSLVAVVVLGCTEAHTGTDGGALADTPLAADAPPPSCTLGPTAMPPPAVGDACFCDGPFAIAGDIVYRHGSDLEVIDVSSPRTPTLVRHVARRDAIAEGVAVAGGTLVVAGGMLEAFDLADPRSPSPAGTIDFGSGGTATAVVADGSFVWAGSTDPARLGSIEAIDASDPSTLMRHGSVSLGARRIARELAVSGDLVFALVDQELDTEPFLTATLVVIRRDHDAPAILSETPLPRSASLGQLAADGDLVAVSLLGEGTTLFDVSDPASPDELVHLEGSTGATAIDGSLAVFPSATGAFVLYDVSVPSAPRELASLTIGTDTAHAWLLSDAIVVSGGWGLGAVPLDCD